MNYFVFDFNLHSGLIKGFLDSATLSHNQQKKSLAWFYWKFRDNPFGESILACAEDKGKIVGCVAYGIQPFLINGEVINGVLSFETFVHPEYQGLGIFTKLIDFAEVEARNRGVDFMLNFPNSNSLKGFLKTGWKQIESAEYWIKANDFWTIPFNLNELKKSFQPSTSNLSSLYPPTDFIQRFSSSNLTSVIDGEYLKWRFFKYPVSEYIVLDTMDFYSILRIGNRGKLKEGQVLFINPKDNKNFRLQEYLKMCKSKVDYDIISFPVSAYNPIRPILKRGLFIKVPNRTNVCFKILNKDKITEAQVSKISLSAINYHTY